MNMVKISIIVPTYNGEQYILKCINSLLDQTLKEIEIIVIDDGSTDNTKNLVLSIKDPRVKYLYFDTYSLCSIQQEIMVLN